MGVRNAAPVIMDRNVPGMLPSVAGTNAMRMVSVGPMKQIVSVTRPGTLPKRVAKPGVLRVNLDPPSMAVIVNVYRRMRGNRTIVSWPVPFRMAFPWADLRIGVSARWLASRPNTVETFTSVYRSSCYGSLVYWDWDASG